MYHRKWRNRGEAAAGPPASLHLHVAVEPSGGTEYSGHACYTPVKTEKASGPFVPHRFWMSEAIITVKAYPCISTPLFFFH